MSYVASTIGTIPKSGFEWYIVFLEGAFSDEIKKEIDANFSAMGQEAGPNMLVIRGYNSTSFRNELYEAAAFYDEDWYNRVSFPAILVTDQSPALALGSGDELRKAKVMLFPLDDHYRSKGSIIDFLKKLLETLKSDDANSALENMEPSNLEKGWGWLRQYLQIKPSYSGFSFDVGKAIDDLVAG